MLVIQVIYLFGIVWCFFESRIWNSILRYKSIYNIVITFFQIFTYDFHFSKKDFVYPEVFSSHLWACYLDNE